MKRTTREERLDLVRAARRLLQGLDYSELDLVLETFGFPTADEWYSEMGDYVLSMLNQGSDDDLRAIVDYLEGKPSQKEGDVRGGDQDEWRPGKFRLFLSHVADERDYAHRLKYRFLSYGVDAFVAHDDIRPADEWRAAVMRRLSDCDAAIALLHADFYRSEWTDQEVGWCLGRGVPTYSVRLGEDPRGFLADRQAFRGHPDQVDITAREVVETLAREKTTRARLIEALVDTLASAGSFEQANGTSILLDRLERDGWIPTSEHIDELEAALEGNSQVAGAYQAPNRIRGWIKRHRSSTQ